MFFFKGPTTKPKPIASKENVKTRPSNKFGKFSDKANLKIHTCCCCCLRMASYFSHTSSRESNNHLEWKQTGTVGGWIWNQRKNTPSFVKYLPWISWKTGCLRTSQWILDDFGNLPLPRSQKNTKALSCLDGLGSWASPKRDKIKQISGKRHNHHHPTKQKRQRYVILQIDRRNFNFPFPSVKFENMHFQMFRFRFFRFFHDICRKKYSFTKRSHHFIATQPLSFTRAAPPATSGSYQFVIPSEGSTIFRASGSTCTDPWGGFQVIQLMTLKKSPS